jgi:orotate phosphoribosyltransferase-like protein
MAISSQINIDVDSAEFLALKTAFDKYETAVKKMPAAWQNVGRASSALDHDQIIVHV